MGAETTDQAGEDGHLILECWEVRVSISPDLVEEKVASYPEIL